MSSLYVIDANVEDLQTLLAERPEGSEVLILDSSYDGVEQIANYVQGRSGIEALHVISHGSAGSVQLGSVLVDESYLVENAEYWERIGQALSNQGDILLYGCNVAQQQEGQLFMSRLAALTGADVAASTNLTGASAFGGDWVLEEQTGHIEATKVDSLSYSDVLGHNVVAAPGKIILETTMSWDDCSSIAIQSDGRILATGDIEGDLNLVRFNSNGTLESSFDKDGISKYDLGVDSHFTDLKIQNDSKIVVVGQSGNNLALARFNFLDGSLDTSFDGDTGVGNGIVITDFGYDDTGSSIVLQSDGKIVAAGSSDGNFILSRYLTDGKLDKSFNNLGKVITNFGGDDDSGQKVAMQSDGKFLVAGYTNVNGNYDFAVARYNANGSLDTSFDGDGKIITDSGVEEGLFDITVQNDGKILAVGVVSTIGSTSSDFALVRYNSNGSLDTTFGQGGRVRTDFGYEEIARGVCLQADGKIVVAGRTQTGDEEGDFALARYNSNGSLDTSFGVSGKVVTNFVSGDWEQAFDLAVLPDGRIVVAGGSGGNWALARYNPNGSLDTSFGASVIKGTVNNDTLVGTTQNDLLQGFAGNDTITGGLGNDTLDGGTGNDSMIGGAGNDTYMVDSIGDRVSETSTLSTEIDTVQSSVTWTLGVNLENLTLTGTGAINGTGNTLNNKIIGNSANNALNGGAGNDSMAGGAGNDSYYVDATGDIVTEAVGAGTDTVFSYLGSYILPGNVENGRIMSTSAANLAGNTLNNTLYAGVGNNILQGGSGIDTVSYAYGVTGTTGVTVNLGVTTAQATGGSGSDTFGGIENVTGSANADRITGNSGNNVLDGGAGSDSLVGGTGNDSYLVDSNSDRIFETSTLISEIDTVQSSVTWTLGANLENLTLKGTGAINGAGNTLNNKIIGNSANNALNGGAGNDSMAGGAGNDSYYVDATGDIVTEAVGAGTDTVFSYLGSYILPGNVENGRIMSTSAANLAGNTLNNTLYAGVGNNILQGGSGIDMVSYAYGVSGTTGVTVNLGVTTAQATGGSGSDTFGGIVNVTGSANADRITGDSGNNVLNGGAGNDTLLGSGGSDNLYGSTGNDSMTGGAGSDSFTFNSALGSSNIDIITDFVHGTDKIVLDDDIFTKIGAPGTLLTGAFRKGAGVTTAGDADDRIILNTTTGALYYDANGSAAGAAVHFATLSGTSTRATITASDFLVVA